MSNRLHDRLHVTSELDQVARVRHWCADQARKATLSADEISEVELAITEALANVIRHSYEGREGCPITVESIVDAGRLELHVVDEGIPFDPDAYGGIDLDDAHEGGYGVFMIDALMDEVERRSGPSGGTELVLVKYATALNGAEQ
ncbi:MAG: hypothetical protein RLZZ623_1125 [Actinomycetota bacterium]